MTINMTNVQNKPSGRIKNVIIAAICVAIPLIGGYISSRVAGNQMMTFATMNKPPLAPPAWLFPIAWTILYILMGLASYWILKSDSKYKVGAICLYISMLIMNFMWSPVFFNMHNYWTALGLIVIMWMTTIILAIVSWFVDRKATYALIPLILWTTFATYLNAGIAVLN